MSNKDLKQLKSLAMSQQWEVTATAGDHLKWCPPSGAPFLITSSTPSSVRTLHNVRAQLTGKGLVMDRQEYKRYLAEVRDLAQRGELIMPPTQREVAALIEAAVIENSGGDALRCELCDPPLTFMSVVGAYAHRHKKHPEPDTEETDVDRDMNNPPHRERLACPLCGFFCWISQPHIMESHLKAEHGQGECPHCHELFKVTKGGLTNHIKACESRLRMPAPAAEPEKLPPFLATLDPTSPPIVVPDPNIENRPEPEPDPTPAPIEEAPVAPAPEPTPAPQRRLTTVTSASSDDELWDYLELILDGPVQMNRTTLAVVNTWMDATRELLALKEKS